MFKLQSKNFIVTTIFNRTYPLRCNHLGDFPFCYKFIKFPVLCFWRSFCKYLNVTELMMDSTVRARKLGGCFNSPDNGLLGVWGGFPSHEAASPTTVFQAKKKKVLLHLAPHTLYVSTIQVLETRA